ncbi:MAG: hypothetical protein IAF02_10175 [Anaerolineae bacterium]|nr:hypothetical protein [Anaerolineae bacterium]
MKEYVKLTWVLILSLILLTGCAYETGQRVASASPTPSLGVQTKSPDNLRPLLFKEGDLNWGLGIYREETAGLINNWGFVAEFYEEEFDEEDLIPDDIMGANLYIDPSRWTPKGYTRGSPIGTYQEVWYYAEETFAQQAGRMNKIRNNQIGIIGTENITPRLNSVVESCWSARNSQVGEYQNCYFLGQYGNYVTTASMFVDGEKLTIAHWIELVDVIQDRLIAQVEKEALSSD